MSPTDFASLVFTAVMNLAHHYPQLAAGIYAAGAITLAMPYLAPTVNQTFTPLQKDIGSPIPVCGSTTETEDILSLVNSITSKTAQTVVTIETDPASPNPEGAKPHFPNTMPSPQGSIILEGLFLRTTSAYGVIALIVTAICVLVLDSRTRAYIRPQIAKGIAFLAEYMPFLRAGYMLFMTLCLVCVFFPYWHYLLRWAFWEKIVMPTKHSTSKFGSLWTVLLDCFRTITSSIRVQVYKGLNYLYNGRIASVVKYLPVNCGRDWCPLAWRWLWCIPTIVFSTAFCTVTYVLALGMFPQHVLMPVITIATSFATPYALSFLEAVGGLECKQDYIIIVMTVIVVLLLFFAGKQVSFKLRFAFDVASGIFVTLSCQKGQYAVARIVQILVASLISLYKTCTAALNNWVDVRRESNKVAERREAARTARRAAASEAYRIAEEQHNLQYRAYATHLDALSHNPGQENSQESRELLEKLKLMKAGRTEPKQPATDGPTPTAKNIWDPSSIPRLGRDALRESMFEDEVVHVASPKQFRGVLEYITDGATSTTDIVDSGVIVGDEAPMEDITAPEDTNTPPNESQDTNKEAIMSAQPPVNSTELEAPVSAVEFQATVEAVELQTPVDTVEDEAMANNSIELVFPSSSLKVDSCMPDAETQSLDAPITIDDEDDDALIMRMANLSLKEKLVTQKRVSTKVQEQQPLVLPSINTIAAVPEVLLATLSTAESQEQQSAASLPVEAVVATLEAPPSTSPAVDIHRRTPYTSLPTTKRDDMLNLDDFPLPAIYQKTGRPRDSNHIESAEQMRNRLLGGPSILTLMRRERDQQAGVSAGNSPSGSGGASAGSDTSSRNSNKENPPVTSIPPNSEENAGQNENMENDSANQVQGQSPQDQSTGVKNNSKCAPPGNQNEDKDEKPEKEDTCAIKKDGNDGDDETPSPSPHGGGVKTAAMATVSLATTPTTPFTVETTEKICMYVEDNDTTTNEAPGTPSINQSDASTGNHMDVDSDLASPVVEPHIITQPSVLQPTVPENIEVWRPVGQKELATFNPSNMNIPPIPESRSTPPAPMDTTPCPPSEPSSLNIPGISTYAHVEKPEPKTTNPPIPHSFTFHMPSTSASVQNTATLPAFDPSVFKMPTLPPITPVSELLKKPLNEPETSFKFTSIPSINTATTHPKPTGEATSAQAMRPQSTSEDPSNDVLQQADSSMAISQEEDDDFEKSVYVGFGIELDEVAQQVDQKDGNSKDQYMHDDDEGNADDEPGSENSYYDDSDSGSSEDRSNETTVRPRTAKIELNDQAIMNNPDYWHSRKKGVKKISSLYGYGAKSWREVPMRAWKKYGDTDELHEHLDSIGIKWFEDMLPEAEHSDWEEDKHSPPEEIHTDEASIYSDSSSELSDLSDPPEEIDTTGAEFAVNEKFEETKSVSNEELEWEDVVKKPSSIPMPSDNRDSESDSESLPYSPLRTTQSEDVPDKPPHSDALVEMGPARKADPEVLAQRKIIKLKSTKGAHQKSDTPNVVSTPFTPTANTPSDQLAGRTILEIRENDAPAPANPGIPEHIYREAIEAGCKKKSEIIAFEKDRPVRIERPNIVKLPTRKKNRISLPQDLTDTKETQSAKTLGESTTHLAPTGLKMPTHKRRLCISQGEHVYWDGACVPHECFEDSKIGRGQYFRNSAGKMLKIIEGKPYYVWDEIDQAYHDNNEGKEIEWDPSNDDEPEEGDSY